MYKQGTQVLITERCDPYKGVPNRAMPNGDRDRLSVIAVILKGSDLGLVGVFALWTLKHLFKCDFGKESLH